MSTPEFTPISATAHLDPRDRANFATTARLLSCLVTESLVDALYAPCSLPEHTAGIAVIFRSTMNTLDIKPTIDDILALVHLHHDPIFKEAQHISTSPGSRRLIGLLDPLDMLPTVYLPDDHHGESGDRSTLVAPAQMIAALSEASLDIDLTEMSPSVDALKIWNRFSMRLQLDEEIRVGIAGELSSSIKWQAYSFENPSEGPTFSSPSIEWEQSIVNGHPTHPVGHPRRNHGFQNLMFPDAQNPCIPTLLFPIFNPGDYDLHHPRLRFASLPRSQLNVLYEFEDLTRPLVNEAFRQAGRPLLIQDDHVIVPVHELQVAHIEDKFPDAIVLLEEVSLPLLAQQSLRSVVIPGSFSASGLQLKLGVGMKLTSAVRTISPESAFFGPHFSKRIVPALHMDLNVLTVAKELGSVVHKHPDGSIAKHCAAIVRECYETLGDSKEEKLIVCTSLVEYGHAGTDKVTPSVIRVFGLDTVEKRTAWFREFVSVFLKAFLPPMMHNGVAFECHPQNCVARFDAHTQALKGFIIRDFGGLKVHPPTLKKTTGLDLDYVEGHSVISQTLEDVYTRMYHTVFHNHFQQLIRVLGIHYNGLGWDIVREELQKVVPSDHPLYDTWLSWKRTTFPGKCFMRMRMVGAYRFHLHGPFPNLLHYRGIRESAGGEAANVTRSSN